MRVTLIHNRASGDHTQPSTAALLTLIRDAGHDVSSKSVKEDRDELRNHPGDLVVVAGGDGTIGTVTACLIGTPVPLAVLPLGTANNISTTLGVAGIPLATLI